MRHAPAMGETREATGLADGPRVLPTVRGRAADELLTVRMGDGGGMRMLTSDTSMSGGARCDFAGEEAGEEVVDTAAGRDNER